MLCLLFYGYATGGRGSRKLEEKCLSDHIYLYLMQCYSPDHRTISDFRKNNIEEIRLYFVEIIRLINKLGITQVGKIYVDGTKIKANAGAKQTKDAEGFEKWLLEIGKEVDALLKEAALIDDEEDRNFKVNEEQESLKKKLSNRADMGIMIAMNTLRGMG